MTVTLLSFRTCNNERKRICKNCKSWYKASVCPKGTQTFLHLILHLNLNLSLWPYPWGNNNALVIFFIVWWIFYAVDLLIKHKVTEKVLEMEVEAMSLWLLFIILRSITILQDLLILYGIFSHSFGIIIVCYVQYGMPELLWFLISHWHDIEFPFPSVSSYRLLRRTQTCISITTAYALTYGPKLPERLLAHAVLWWAIDAFAQWQWFINYMDCWICC